MPPLSLILIPSQIHVSLSLIVTCFTVTYKCSLLSPFSVACAYDFRADPWYGIAHYREHTSGNDHFSLLPLVLCLGVGLMNEGAEHFKRQIARKCTVRCVT